MLLSDWWGSGIVHAKVWISDSRDVYIGSANNDWKSLTQVLLWSKLISIVFTKCYRPFCIFSNSKRKSFWFCNILSSPPKWTAYDIIELQYIAFIFIVLHLGLWNYSGSPFYSGERSRNISHWLPRNSKKGWNLL